MTTEKNPTKKTPWQKAWQAFTDFGKGWGLILVIAGGLATFHGRLFTSPEIKHDTEKLVKEGPTAEQRTRALIMDSIYNENAMKSRAMRDSMFVDIIKDIKEIKKSQKEQDCINKLNADQTFQIKQELKKRSQ